VLPIGARNVTNDLAIGLRISLDSAEKIKLALSLEPKTAVEVNEDGDVVDRKEADQLDLTGLGLEENLKNVSKKTVTDGIIKPRLREILNMIKLEIQKSGYLGLTPSGVVLTGGGAQTAGVLDIAKQELGMPVRIGLPQGATGLVDDINSPAFATSLGLLIYGSQFQEDEVRIPLVGRIEIKNLVSKSLSWIRSKLP
jgi:cell division protein FtsA